MQRPAAHLSVALALSTALGSATSAAPGAAGTRVHDSLAAYRSFLAAGARIEDPALFTAASRVYLARAPRAAGAEAARLAELDAAAPLRRVVVGDRAALIPRARLSKTRPVLLERVAGTWRIDLVEAEKSLEPDPAGGLRFRYDGSPYLPVLGLTYPRSVVEGELEPVDLFGEDPASAIARLEGVRTPAGRLRLAEILLRNCWLVDAALPLYEEAVRGAEDPWPYARAFGFRALAVGQPDRAIPLLEPFEPRSDRLLGLLHRAAGRFDAWQRYERRSVLEHLQRKGILEPVPAPAAGPGVQAL